ncbi:MAG: chloride channel protein [Anaerolineales bacterium]|nr:chloride channel protein [Anaerolineales bacterium]
MTALSKDSDRLADFTMDRRVLALALMAAAVGVISVVVAYTLIWLIDVITNLAYFQRLSDGGATPAANQLGLIAVLIPALGGLAVGLMARYGSSKIRGHGIPEALEAILIARSRIEPKVAVLKPVSSAISIGTGGPFGAEGPIIMTGGAFGSLFGQFFHLSAVERRILLAAGAAAGMAAIFAAPLAAVLLAVELLLFEWKPRSFIPVAAAAATAGVLRDYVLGDGPIFPVAPHAVLHVETLVLAVLIGLAAGLVSGLLTNMVYGAEELFERLPIHWMWWPALGGLVVGVGGLIEPRVLGVGYDVIHQLLRGELVGAAVIGLLTAKAVVWAIALGSGTSGGVLAPLLIVGGALGALAAPMLPVGDAGLWAMVAMAAMMGGTMRSPLAATVFTLEVTHDLNALPAVFLGCVAAQAATVLLLRRSILTEKVARRGHHIAYEYSVDPLDTLRVGDVMDPDPPTIAASLPVVAYSDLIGRGDSPLARRQGTPIVDSNGHLVGIVTRGDVLRALELENAAQLTVLEAGTRSVLRAFPDEPLREAVNRMLRNNVGRLPVVSREDPRCLVGYLGRTGIMEARLRQLTDEDVRERRWVLPRLSQVTKRQA